MEACLRSRLIQSPPAPAPGRRSPAAAQSPPLTPEEARIAALFFTSGKGIGELVAVLHPGKNLRGAAYQQAAAPVVAAIRKAGMSSTARR